MKKILTVIPIRGGSVGVKDKNIRLLNNNPLFSYPLNAAREASIEDIIISTDSERYAELASEYGVNVPFIRPQDLGSSKVRLHHVMKHALDYFDNKGHHYDAVMSLQATVPLIKASTINKVVEKFQSEDCLSVGTVSEIRHGHPYLAKTIDETTSTAADFLSLEEGVVRYPRQSRPDLYYFNGAIFLRDRSLLDNMDESTNCMGNAPMTVSMDEYESINIDEEFDFEVAEYILKK